MKLQFLLFAALIVYAEGLLFNLNQTHRPSLEERVDLLEKHLAEERRQKYTLQVEYDHEKQKIAEIERQLEEQNETVQILLQVYNTAPKRFQDITTQIRGALLSISSLDNKHSLDIQKLAKSLKDVQTLLPNLTSNISEIQNHFQEKGIVLTHMIEAVKHNQATNKEEMARLKTSLIGLSNKQRALESTVNTTVVKQYHLQSQLTNIEDAVIFLAIPKKVQRQFSFLSYHWNTTENPSVFKNSVIAFPSMKINVGGGYENTSGVFTCPSDGYYVFHWNVMSTNHEQPCSSAILKNGVEIIRNAIGGNLGAFHLNKNDRTWIKASSNCTMATEHSSFSGFKIM